MIAFVHSRAAELALEPNRRFPGMGTDLLPHGQGDVLPTGAGAPANRERKPGREESANPAATAKEAFNFASVFQDSEAIAPLLGHCLL